MSLRGDPMNEVADIELALDRIANSAGLYETIAACERWLAKRSERPAYKRDRFKPGDLLKAWQRQGGICPYCQKPMVDPRRNSQVVTAEQTSAEHLLPCKEGGDNKQRCVAVHFSCNASRGARDLLKVSKSNGKTLAEMLKDMAL